MLTNIYPILPCQNLQQVRAPKVAQEMHDGKKLNDEMENKSKLTAPIQCQILLSETIAKQTCLSLIIFSTTPYLRRSSPYFQHLTAAIAALHLSEIHST
ncbi:hypothetical protein Tco_0068810, partial [Tanacetum coccineum]